MFVRVRGTSILKRIRAVRPVDAGVALLCAMLVFGGGKLILTLRDNRAASAPVPSRKRSEPRTREELLLIYVGASFCQASGDRDLRNAVKAAARVVRQRAEETGADAVTVGVSIDWAVELGSKHLARYGEFDEIIVGRNWFNTGARPYI